MRPFNHRALWLLLPHLLGLIVGKLGPSHHYSSSTSLCTTPDSSDQTYGFYSTDSSTSTSSWDDDDGSAVDNGIDDEDDRPRYARAVQKRIHSSTPVPRKSTRGDASFLKKLAIFRQALFCDGERLEKIYDTVLQASGPTHLTKQPVAKWLPIEVTPYPTCPQSPLIVVVAVVQGNSSES